jgi:hypothetical protein
MNDSTPIDWFDSGEKKLYPLDRKMTGGKMKRHNIVVSERNCCLFKLNQQ